MISSPHLPQVLPHLDAAYNLARWLVHSDRDAQNVVQAALARAMRRIGAMSAERARIRLLLIVRHACFSRLKANAVVDPVAFGRSDGERINAAIASLPPLHREVLVLREMEDLSYAAIAQITETPVGTVVARLASARAAVQMALKRAEV